MFNRKELVTISTLVEDSWSIQIKQQYTIDAIVKEQLKQPKDGFSKSPQGLLLFQKRVYIPTKLRKNLVTEWHELPAHGH